MIPVVGLHRPRSPCGVGFDLAQALRPHDLQPGYAVGLRPGPQRLETRQFLLVQGHDELAGLAERDGMGLGERFEFGLALAAQPRLERPGCVVQAGVEDAAVVAGLMGRQGRLTFDQGEPHVRPAPQQLVRGGQTHDAAADHEDVGAVDGHGPAPADGRADRCC